MVEFSSKSIEVKMDGQTYALKMCSTMAAKEMFKKMKDLDVEQDTDEVIEIQEGVLRSCGAPDDLLNALDFEQFSELCNMVLGLKKS